MVRGSSIVVVYSTLSIFSAFVLVFTFTWCHWINSLSRSSRMDQAGDGGDAEDTTILSDIPAEAGE